MAMAEGEGRMAEDRMASVLTSLLSNQPVLKPSRKRQRETSTNDEEQMPQRDIKDVVNCVHVLPTSSVWEYERRLKQVTTRGIVQLFNAVNKQQKELQTQLEAVGSSETKRSKVLSSVGKKEFLDMLKDNHKVVSRGNQNRSITKQKEDVPGWALLRDDCGLDTAMQSWQDNDNNE